jgi:hypothetical protein
MRFIYAAEAQYTKYTNDATEAMTEVLVFNLKKNTATLKSGSNETFPTLTSNPREIQVFFNKIKLERGWTQNYVENLQERLPYVTNLIALLKKEYDL